MDRFCLDPIALYDQHPHTVQTFWKISPCPTLISISKPLLLILCLLPNVELNNALWIIPDIQLVKAVDKHKWPYSEMFLLNPRKLPRVLWPTSRSSSSVTKVGIYFPWDLTEPMFDNEKASLLRNNVAGCVEDLRDVNKFPMFLALTCITDPWTTWVLLHKSIICRLFLRSATIWKNSQMNWKTSKYQKRKVKNVVNTQNTCR